MVSVRQRSIAMSLAGLLLCGPLWAVGDGAPLSLSDAPGAVGSEVLTADAVKLGRLVGIRDQGDGTFLCIVQLDQALRVSTSALLVAGLLRATDGSLRLPEDAATLAAQMKLPFPDL